MKKTFFFSFLFASIVFSSFVYILHAESLSSIPSDFQFTRNLGLGNRGQDVENLQCVLGLSEPSGYFGQVTSAAVLQFQNAHVAEILTSSGLTMGTGYFGNATRAYLNAELQNASSTNATSTPTCPTYIPPTYQPQPTPTPNPYPQPQPTPPQPPITQLPPQQPLPLVPVLNPNGSLSYYNPNSQPVQNPYGTFTSPYSTNTSLYPNQMNTLFPPSNFSNTTPPSTSSGPSSNSRDNFYTTNADFATLSQYRAGGNCSGHMDPSNSATYYENCPGHPHYYIDHVANPGRKCAIDPTIAYLEKDLLPKAFPGVSFSSDCRVPGDGAPADNVHTNGVALDIQKDGAAIPKDFGDKLVIWAQRPENLILGLKQIIFYEQQWNFLPYTDASGQHFHWVGPAPFGCQGGGDACHLVHVHFSVGG